MKFFELKNRNEEENLEEVKEETNMNCLGFVKRHWKGLTAGAVALATTIGLTAYAVSKKKDECDEYDYDDAEIEDSEEENSEEE